MKEWATRELRFGEILDVSFQTVKGNLRSMLLISLLFWAPAFVVQVIGLLTGFTGSSGYTGSMGILYLFLILRALAVMLSMAAVMLIVRDVRQEKDWRLREICRQVRSRFWPLLGASIMFGLLLVVFTLVLFLLFGLLFGLFNMSGISMFISRGSLSGTGTLWMIIAFVAVFCLFLFLMTRFGFYFPAVVFGESAPALSKSWRLTKNNVWRLIGLYLVITLIMFVIVLALSVILIIISSDSRLLTALIGTITSLIAYIFYSAVMAVVYFDLVVRNEAGDLLDLTAHYDNSAPAHPTSPEADAAQAELHTDISTEKW